MTTNARTAAHDDATLGRVGGGSGDTAGDTAGRTASAVSASAIGLPAPGALRPSRRLPRRLTQLYAGLALYGLSIALLAEADLGLMPWSVLEQGLARSTGRSLGTMSIVVGALVLLAWIPLRQRPGVGTVSNVVVIGVVLDAALAVLPAVQALVPRMGLVVAGTVLNAVATAMYVGARLGPGPRDGLMTGLVRRTRRPVRQVRTAIEVCVVLVGVALGGVLGPGTVFYALLVGPLVQPLLPLLAVAPAGGNTVGAQELTPGDGPDSPCPGGTPCPHAPHAPPGTARSRTAPARSS